MLKPTLRHETNHNEVHLAAAIIAIISVFRAIPVALLELSHHLSFQIVIEIITRGLSLVCLIPVFPSSLLGRW